MAERNSSEIEASLIKKGFAKREGAKHTILTFVHQGVTTPIYTKLSRGSGYKKVGDSRLSKRQILELVDCTMTADDYKSTLRSNGFII